jgi:hypothetical protein
MHDSHAPVVQDAATVPEPKPFARFWLPEIDPRGKGVAPGGLGMIIC